MRFWGVTNTRKRDAWAFFAGACVSGVLFFVAHLLLPVNSPSIMRYLRERPDLLADQPDILQAARSVIRSRQLSAEGAIRALLMTQKWRKLLHPAFAPTLGDPGAPILLIDFTDYTCAPCKVSTPIVARILAKNKDVRIAIMFLPIGGVDAEFAARVGYAAYREDPSRFPRLHTILMQQGALDPTSVIKAASDAGFDTNQLVREASNSETRNHLDQVRDLATDFHLTGVPAFAVGATLILGGTTEARLQVAIDAERHRQGIGSR